MIQSDEAPRRNRARNAPRALLARWVLTVLTMAFPRIRRSFVRNLASIAAPLALAGCEEPSVASDSAEDVAIEPACVTLADGRSAVDDDTARALAELADSSTLDGLDDLEERVAALGSTLAVCGDPRGLFAVTYLPITQRAVTAIRDGSLDDPAWAERLTIRFGARYLDALRDELDDADGGWAWARYYALAEDEGASRARVVATGVAVHLLLDLPLALVDAESRDTHEADFVRFGAVLAEAREQLVRDLRASYGVDTEDLFGGFFVGDWIDQRLGEGVASTFAFQTVRAKAWRNRWLLQHGLGIVAHGEMAASFRTIDGAFATLDASGAL